MIPRKIHFIFGLSADFGGIPFGFAHWVAVQTARRCNPDYEIHFWFEHKPDTPYFRDIEKTVSLHRIKAPEEIFGKPLPHFAHRSDVLRLQIIREHGGFYLDVDTISVKPFDDLLQHEMCMALVKNAGKLYGLCNAVFAAAPGARFLDAWLEGFRNFRSQGYDRFYDEFGSEYPLHLAKRMPEAITVLEENAFFVPDMTPEGLTELFIASGDYPRAWCHHLWEKNSVKALSRFNERNYAALPCTYTRLISRMIAKDCARLTEGRARWCEEQLGSKSARLNIGCGTKFDANALNCDLHQATGADFLFDATRDPWPFPNDSVIHVDLIHVLEHFPGDLSYFFKELYRVSRNGCIIDIRVPHPRHDWFLQDPTHFRAWIATSFLHLDRRICNSWFLNGNTETPLALYWDVDFETITQELSSNNGEILKRLESLTGLNTQTTMAVFSNMICETHIALRARK